MVTLLSLVIGFFSSFIKPAFGYFQDRQDKKHELDMMQLQLEFNQANLEEKLQEVRLASDSQDLVTRYLPSEESDVARIINEITKTLIAVTLMAVYCVVMYDYHTVLTMTMDSRFYAEHMWTDEDYALLAAIVGYYYGTVVSGRRSK